MASPLGKVDVSASWLPCPSCPYRHVITAPCPPAGAWLVLTFCRSCDAKTGVRCRLHRDRRALPEAELTIPEGAA